MFALLDLLIQYGTSEDGRLHVEKFYRTVNDKRGQGTGHRAPGFEEARRLLKV